ncbi:sensor histidine kinase [Dactylosporangium fulvum]|uniref:sensor histidine kinase n=1 Tax=Dactylosporangium fulvum TaxID=53359 RepID=UPI0031E2C36B
MKHLRKWLLVALVALAALCALPVTGASGILASLAAVGVVATAVMPRLALSAALLSLVVDAAHRGPPAPAALWFPVELAALAVLQVRVTRRGTVIEAAAVGLAIVALPLRMTLHVPTNRFEASVLLVATTFFVGVCATGAGLHLRAGDQRRRRAEERARRAQRLDLARDLHDLVAHEVTGIVVQAQAAQVAGDPDALARIEAAGLRALDAMDNMVRTLRGADEQAPLRVHGLGDLPEVVARFDATGPARATLRMAPGATLSPEAGVAAYHVVVEALTNVRRHAPKAATVVVSLDRAGLLTIVDSGGGGPRRRRTGGGTGLAGVAERVGALGGTLYAGPHEAGWRVTCDLSRSADVRAPESHDA